MSTIYIDCYHHHQPDPPTAPGSLLFPPLPLSLLLLLLAWVADTQLHLIDAAVSGQDIVSKIELGVQLDVECLFSVSRFFLSFVSFYQ